MLEWAQYFWYKQPSVAHALRRRYTAEMRGVGGPLLTIGDLLSDLAVDRLARGGDASVPSSPSAAHAVGEANPACLSRLFEVAGVPPLRCSRFCFHTSIHSSLVCCAYVCMFVAFRMLII
jgi:hypothetical protein